MTGDKIEGRYWPTTATYALAINCSDCGQLAFSCPCAVADNDATGMSSDWDGAA